MTNYPTGVQEPPGSAIKFPRKGNKFNAHKMSIDGHQFDSKAEGAYYVHLKNLKLDFKIHEPFTILDSFTLEHPKKHVRACKYTPDFSIYEHGKLISVIDIKGANATKTEASVLRMKMFEARYKIPVVIAEYDAKNGIFEEY
ncbi:DUF1064 domain-containing protein [Lentilactobacillus buchneri]|uniref:DUF1064 domain-containing protein n=1 Tax=Lentilactobacillus buchneri TaxID=1581 RepID=UPI0021A74958|nr:DUF1064 domain-containing protein [Lentilactobacillus buchneri]MCT3542067.1 DUF1064 domain-containing protein [Lentilactobacillus buchneri]